MTREKPLDLRELIEYCAQNEIEKVLEFLEFKCQMGFRQLYLPQVIIRYFLS
jgi:hypothetical protein